MHAVIQVPPDGVVGNCNCCCHSFAPALLMGPCVSSARPSVLSPQASRAILHSQPPADCIKPILVRKRAVGIFPATTIPNHLLRHHGIFLSLRYFPSINKPSCILSQHKVCYPCTVERLVDASPFLLLPDTSLFEPLLIHPCTML